MLFLEAPGHPLIVARAGREREPPGFGDLAELRGGGERLAVLERGIGPLLSRVEIVVARPTSQIVAAANAVTRTQRFIGPLPSIAPPHSIVFVIERIAHPSS